jgi:hypothetical protein
MHTTPQLVVNCGNFIITNGNIPGCLHCSFNGSNDNLMDGFNHLPTSGIKLVLARCIFHLKRLKQLLHFFKIYERSTKLQDPKNSNKLNEFALIVYNNSPNTHHFSNGVSTPTSPQPLVFGIFVIN